MVGSPQPKVPGLDFGLQGWIVASWAGFGGSPRSAAATRLPLPQSFDGALRSVAPRSSLPGVGVLSAAWALPSSSAAKANNLEDPAPF